LVFVHLFSVEMESHKLPVPAGLEP
jgi:hypothetical protein